MQQIDIPALIAKLNTESSITNITSNRIYWQTPTEIQTWIYITISVRREFQSPVNKATDLRVRFIWNNDTIKFSDLRTLRKNFVNALIKDNTNVCFSNFYWFAETSTYFEDYFDWNRPYIEIWFRAFLTN